MIVQTGTITVSSGSGSTTIDFGSGNVGTLVALSITPPSSASTYNVSIAGNIAVTNVTGQFVGNMSVPLSGSTVAIGLSSADNGSYAVTAVLFPVSSGGSGYGKATVQPFTAVSSTSVSLPATTNGVYDCYLQLTQNTSAGNLGLYFNNDQTSGSYKWLQMSSNDSSNTFSGPGAPSDTHIALTFFDATVSIKAGTEVYAHFKLVLGAVGTGLNGEINYIRSADSSQWAGTVHGRYIGQATSIYLTTGGGTFTGKLVIIPG